MKEMMKRMTALVLALALIAGQVVVPTSAAEETLADGTVVTTEKTETTDADTGAVTTGETKTTEKSDASGSKETWDNKTTVASSSTSADQKTETQTTSTTQDQGSKTIEVTMTPAEGGQNQTTETVEENTKTETKEKTETTVEKDEVLDAGENAGKKPDALAKEDSKETETTKEYGNSEAEGKLEKEGLTPVGGQETKDFEKVGESTPAEGVDGEFKKDESTVKPGENDGKKETIAVNPDPLANTDARVEMTVDTVDEDKKEFETSAALKAHIIEKEGLTNVTPKEENGKLVYETTNANGEKVVITMDKDNVQGYNKKTYGAATDNHDASMIKPEDIKDENISISYDEEKGNKVTTTETRKPTSDELGFDPTKGEAKTDDDGKAYIQQTVTENGKTFTRDIYVVTNEKGDEIGYKIITTEDTAGTPAAVTPDAPSVAASTVPAEVPEFTNADGRLEKVVVTEIKGTDANGNEIVIGYTEETIITEQDGTPVSSVAKTHHFPKTTVTYSDITATKTTVTEEVIYGTTTTQTADVTITATTTGTETREVSEEDFKLVTGNDGKLYVSYKGQMLPVTEVKDQNGNPVKGATATENHGEITLTNPLINHFGYAPNKNEGSTKALDDPNFERYYDEGLWSYHYYIRIPEQHNSQKYGLESAYRMETSDGKKDTLSHQFEVEVGGLKYYVYAADYQGDQINAQSNYELEAVRDSKFYTDPATADKVAAIAANGFWGSAYKANDPNHGNTDLGYITTTIQFLIDKNDELPASLKLSPDVIANLQTQVQQTWKVTMTPGMALLATQAALLSCGEDGNSIGKDTGKGYRDIVGEVSQKVDRNKDGAINEPSDVKDGFYYDTQTNGTVVTDEPTDAEAKMINALFYALTNLATAPEEMDEINKGSVTNTAINVLETVNDDTKDYDNDGATNDKVIKTEVEFTLDIKSSKLTGNLIVDVIVNGKVQDSVQIVTPESNIVGKIVGESTDSTTFAIPVFVSDGDGEKAITLNLHGYQNIEPGAYVFTADSSTDKPQTYIGIAEGKREVNMNIGVVLTVKTDKVEMENDHSTYNETRTTKQGWSKTNKYQRSANQTTKYTDTVENTVTKGTKTTVVDYFDQTITKTSSVVTDTQFIADPEEPGEGGTVQGRTLRFRGDTTELKELDNVLLTIEEEEVPLANAPITGDVSIVWGVVSAAALAAYFILGIKRKVC